MIYFIVFIISVFFSYLCTRIDKSKSKKNKVLFYVCAAISILLPSILAGLRDLSIGTDVNYYVAPDFVRAQKFDNLIDYINAGIYRERLYLTLVFIITKLTSNIYWLLFVIQLLITTFVFIGGYKHKDKISFPMVMSIFFLLFYNNGLNVVRQYLAATLIFAVMHLLEDKKYIKFSIFVIIASLFHSTAIIALAFPVIHYLVSSGSYSRRRAFSICIIVAVTTACVFFRPLMTGLLELGIVSDHYSYYINNGVTSRSNIFTLLYAIQIIFILIFYQKMRKNVYEFEFYKTNAFMLLIILQISKMIANGERISFYFNIINIYLISQIPKIVSNKKYKFVMYAVLIAIGTGYWIYVTAVNNAGQTYPYMLLDKTVLM